MYIYSTFGRALSGQRKDCVMAMLGGSCKNSVDYCLGMWKAIFLGGDSIYSVMACDS